MKRLPALCLTIVALILFYGCSELVLPFNDTKMKMRSYTDATGDNGNSIITSKLKDGIHFTYTLKDGFDYPYAGAEIFPDSGFLDLHKYKYIDITLSSDTNIAVNVYLKTFQDSCTVMGNYITYRFLEHKLLISNVPRVYRINIKSMKTPEWWYVVNKKDQVRLGKPDLHKVIQYDVATSSIYLNRPGFVHIHSIKIVRNPMPLIAAFSVLILSAFIIGLLKLSKILRKRQRIISYQKIDNPVVEDTQEKRIATYIGSNYQDCSLSIETVGLKTGVHWSKVSSIIKNQNGMTFKKYLNAIRIAEAKRLLVESDRQIIDIALSVGYGNVSHFNRVFREMENCSPREFRCSKVSGSDVNTD